MPSAPGVLVVCGMPFEAAIADGPGVTSVCGPGPWRVAQRLHGMLDGPGDWAGIVSFGCAGGLDPALACGDCVVATAVLTPDGLVATDPDWSRALLDRLPGARPGLLAGADAPLATPAAKAALWRHAGAAAVDMETHAAALAARRHGLPFAACRVVLDPAWRTVPAAALAGLDTGGVWPVLRALVRAPGQIASVCALAGEAWVARRSLLRARARLGAGLGCYCLPPSSLS
ncbi:squalene--hopene cyclase [Massilia sp. NEAU-DD11]|uniref:Squalene--hopene cyclase n=1 Tax=Massilia cellulosiltytica TaxID=2683234 RepID=A0A7X3K6T5_9BURK|nr:squalene--hopene cyclase [Telluria cellulosilytica]MVW59747.1 squalene--hopene cyclase [Telluria cellulosilytica]